MENIDGGGAAEWQKRNQKNIALPKEFFQDRSNTQVNVGKAIGLPMIEVIVFPFF